MALHSYTGETSRPHYTMLHVCVRGGLFGIRPGCPLADFAIAALDSRLRGNERLIGRLCVSAHPAHAGVHGPLADFAVPPWIFACAGMSGGSGAIRVSAHTRACGGP